MTHPRRTDEIEKLLLVREVVDRQRDFVSRVQSNHISRGSVLMGSSGVVISLSLMDGAGWLDLIPGVLLAGALICGLFALQSKHVSAVDALNFGQSLERRTYVCMLEDAIFQNRRALNDVQTGLRNRRRWMRAGFMLFALGGMALVIIRAIQVALGGWPL